MSPPHITDSLDSSLSPLCGLFLVETALGPRRIGLLPWQG